ncbi:hypothetical protein WA158_005392 [Blastocystis sp. Blastoise]
MKYKDLVIIRFFCSVSDGISGTILPFLIDMMKISPLSYGVIVTIYNVISLWSAGFVKAITFGKFSKDYLLLLNCIWTSVGYFLLGCPMNWKILLISRAMSGSDVLIENICNIGCLVCLFLSDFSISSHGFAACISSLLSSLVIIACINAEGPDEWYDPIVTQQQQDAINKAILTTSLSKQMEKQETMESIYDRREKILEECEGLLPPTKEEEEENSILIQTSSSSSTRHRICEYPWSILKSIIDISIHTPIVVYLSYQIVFQIGQKGFVPIRPLVLVDRFGISVRENAFAQAFTYSITLFYRLYVFKLFYQYISNKGVILIGFVSLILSRIFSISSVDILSWIVAFIPLQKLGEESLDIVLISLYIKIMPPRYYHQCRTISKYAETCILLFTPIFGGYLFEQGGNLMTDYFILALQISFIKNPFIVYVLL